MKTLRKSLNQTLNVNAIREFEDIAEEKRNGASSDTEWLLFETCREMAHERIKEIWLFSLTEKEREILKSIKREDFAYARFYKGFSDYPDTYAFYFEDDSSPTGVVQGGGCTAQEWEKLSKIAEKNNEYLSPTE